MTDLSLAQETFPTRPQGPELIRAGGLFPQGLAEPPYRIVTALVAAAAGLNVDMLFSPGRCTAPISGARQLAMYLAHVGLGLPQTDVAQAFNRDRSTVAHACRRIEDMRDEAAFDHHVARMESCLRWAWSMES